MRMDCRVLYALGVAFLSVSQLANASEDPLSPDNIHQTYGEVEAQLALNKATLSESRVAVSLMLDEHVAIDNCSGSPTYAQMQQASDVAKMAMLNQRRMAALSTHYEDPTSEIIKIYTHIETQDVLSRRLADFNAQVVAVEREFAQISAQLSQAGCDIYPLQAPQNAVIDALVDSSVDVEAAQIALKVIEHEMSMLSDAKELAQ